MALGLALPVVAQTPNDDAAMQLLNAASKAYNEGNVPFAAEKFREFLQKFGGHKNAAAARYGLGLALLEPPLRDYPKAIESLLAAANDAAFDKRPQAYYYAATARRMMGLAELQRGWANPAEMPQRQQAAAPHFREAAQLFRQALEAFEKTQPPQTDWQVRCRCDAAEMLLHLQQPKEARQLLGPLFKDGKPPSSAWTALANYHYGVACYLQGDYPAAARALEGLAPFDQPFGLHARYLRGRIHLADGELAEAAVAMNAVLADYDRLKKAAAAALAQPDRFRNDPWERERLETLTRLPPPEYVAGAAFHAACIDYENGKFADALTKFQLFVKDYAHSKLKDDALLRAGMCQVQLKLWDEAVRTLQPYVNHPQYGGVAQYWLGKARYGSALGVDPNNPNERQNRLQAAIAAYREALQRTNPDSPARRELRARMMIELGDALLQARQPREAAAIFDQVPSLGQLPAIVLQEALQRAAAAYLQATDRNNAAARVNTFLQQYPNSPLMPWVLLVAAENSYQLAEELARQNPMAGGARYAEAAKRYEEIVSKYPEFEQVQRARLGLALCRLAQKQWEGAIPILEAIPVPARSGELQIVSYLLADCLIRTAPEQAEDALADNMLREKLTAAANHLEAFIAAAPKAEQTPDALLKLGMCYKRLGSGLPAGNERNEALQKARGALERLLREFPQSPLQGHAQAERAKVLALQGDVGGAINALQGFRQPPLQDNPVAPLAIIHLATLLRSQNQAAQAADTLRAARARYEGPLHNDPSRREWLGLLRYHHALALEEAGKLPEARTAYEQALQSLQVVGQTALQIEASHHAVHCVILERQQQLEEAQKSRARPNLPPDQAAQLDNRIKALQGELLQLANQLEQRAAGFKTSAAKHPARARMLYDAAWVRRRAAADPAPAYAQLIAECGELALAVDARLELAEHLAEAGKTDEAIKLLREAVNAEPVDRPPSPETLERVRLRLGVLLYDKADYAAAQGHFEAVAGNPQSPHRPQALYRAAECRMAQKQFGPAIEILKPFRDQPPLQNVPGITDRAVLRLGHAHAQLQQWDAARQAFEWVLGRFGNNNPWSVDARYGLAWALHNLNRLDEAAAHYQQVTEMTQDDRSGRAWLQIGLIRMQQRRWPDAAKALQTVYYTYDLPELKFAAMLEHARVLVEENKPAEAVKILQRVIQEAPANTTWSQTAQERLKMIKK